MNRKKRIADWLEKMSVAVMAVGIFQGVWYGIFLDSVYTSYAKMLSQIAMQRI